MKQPPPIIDINPSLLEDHVGLAPPSPKEFSFVTKQYYKTNVGHG
jgi:hypothetical protein